MVSLFDRLTALASWLTATLIGKNQQSFETPRDTAKLSFLREARFILETQLLPRVQSGKLNAEDKAAFCRVMLLLHEGGAFDAVRQS
jgi:hypothetical protein